MTAVVGTMSQRLRLTLPHITTKSLPPKYQDESVSGSCGLTPICRYLALTDNLDRTVVATKVTDQICLVIVGMGNLGLFGPEIL